MVENDITCGSVKKDEKSNKKIIFFNIFIILFTVSKAWGLDSSNRAYYVLAAIAAVFWAFALLGTKYEIKEILFSGMLLVVSAISLYCSVSTQTWVHTIKKTRITAGFRDIF